MRSDIYDCMIGNRPCAKRVNLKAIKMCPIDQLHFVDISVNITSQRHAAVVQFTVRHTTVSIHKFNMERKSEVPCHSVIAALLIRILHRIVHLLN